jgi:hypothetical protein
MTFPFMTILRDRADGAHYRHWKMTCNGCVFHGEMGMQR